TASDVGWVVGHTYIVYAPLLAGVTSVLYEGKPVGTPDAGAFFRAIEQHGVNVHFTAPTAMRVVRKEDPNGDLMKKYDLSSLRAEFLAGERLDPDTFEWAKKTLAEATRFPLKPGSPTKPVPGFQVEILDPNGTPVPAGEEGLIVMRLPLPPGTMATVWGDDSRFISSYLAAFDGYYLTGDSGYLDEDGYVYVMGRTDDVINVAGHRLSTGIIEAVVASHPAVAESAVIGVHDEVKGQIPRALVVLGDSAEAADPDTVIDELVALVRREIGPVAAFRRV